MIRILLADDHPLTRAGVAAWLEKEEGVELVGQADDGESAWKALLEYKPDIALLDIEMPNGNGIEVAARAARAKLPTQIIILTAYSAQQYAMAAVRAGARGFVLKTAPFPQLKKAISDVSQGTFFLDPSLSLLNESLEPQPLSAREKEVLLLAVQGLPGHAIAARLSITERTVSAHLTSIYTKWGVRNKTEAILLALKRGVILLDEIDIETDFNE